MLVAQRYNITMLQDDIICKIKCGYLPYRGDKFMIIFLVRINAAYNSEKLNAACILPSDCIYFVN